MTETGIGHNSVAAGQLRSLIERVENLETEKKAISEDIRGIYSEAKGNGFDTKAIRTIVRMRKQDVAKREEEALILETYLAALGMI